MKHSNNKDWRTIILLGIVHASSHFYQLILPTLFFYLHREFGYDYVELGFLVTCFFLVSGVGQASSGFLVDRIGPAPVMFFGLGAFVVSALILALASGYAWLVAAALLGGAGNAIFHPVDYSIINHQVSPSRLGHAYSIHGLTGYIGWALAPVLITTLSALYDWRVAMFAVAALIGMILLIAVWQRDLWGRAQPKLDKSETMASSQQSIWQTILSLLSQPTLWGAFLFFAFSLIALSAVQNYTIPSFTSSAYGLAQLTAGSVLSAYMIAAALGMAVGGFFVGATAKTERIIFIALCLAGLCMLLIALQGVTTYVAIALLMMAGIFSGIAAPSRDMLVRRVTPKGATGAVYGLVYSGMDVGASVAPITFGYLVDKGFSMGPWYGAALALVISALLAVLVAYFSQKTP